MLMLMCMLQKRKSSEYHYKEWLKVDDGKNGMHNGEDASPIARRVAERVDGTGGSVSRPRAP